MWLLPVLLHHAAGLANLDATFQVQPPLSQPHTAGELKISSAALSGTSHFLLQRVSDGLNFTLPVIRQGSTHTAVITWTAADSVAPGTYVIVAGTSVGDHVVRLHDGYLVANTSIGHAGSLLNVAGSESFIIFGANFFRSNDIIVRFVDLRGTADVAASQDGDANRVIVLTPAWRTPSDWYAGCSGMQIVPSSVCVPPLLVNVSISLDGGASFAEVPDAISFGYRTALKGESVSGLSTRM
jgi:hypothetical protein